MKFHSVHGSNVVIEEGGSRASRYSSFCDGITFSHKPITPNSKISILLAANQDWTGALRIGLTTSDPAAFTNKKLPRYLCPDLVSKQGYWARPLPETWTVHGNRLTFYVNGRGQFHLFINNDHKGAILTGLPLKEQLWIILDLYGITVSVKFVAHSGSVPTEVIARGPSAVQAYQHALSYGSTPYYHTRIAMIGPPDGKKTLLKKLLLKSGDKSEGDCEGIDTTCYCQTSERSVSEPWTPLKICNRFSVEDAVNNNNNNSDHEEDEVDSNSQNENENVVYGDEEYFKGLAVNIVREMVLQKKKDEERKKTANKKNPFRLQSSLSKMGSSKPKPEDIQMSKESMSDNKNEDLPEELPTRVVELVEKLLKESDNKTVCEISKKSQLPEITFNIWDYGGYAKNLLLHQMFLSPQTVYIFVFDLSQDLDSPTFIGENHGLEFSENQAGSYLSLLHTWLEMIYVSIAYPKDERKDGAQENIVNDIVCTLFPPVLIVGIQEDSTTFDSAVEHQFNKIKESIQDKVFYHLVYPTFYYVGSPETLAMDSMISELREKILEMALQLPYFGTEIPLKWMLFEQAVDRLVEREVYFADMCKLSEVARLEGIECEEEFLSLIHFYHHRGKVWHMASDRFQRNDNCTVVILKPQWFIDHIYKLLNEDAPNLLQENADSNEKDGGILMTKNFNTIWSNAFHHVAILLDILDSTDILYSVLDEDSEDVLEERGTSKCAIPWISKNDVIKRDNFSFDCMILILDFNGLLPVGFFTKLLVRLFRWSSRHEWKRKGNSGKTEVPVDYNHSIKLQKIYGHRIQVAICQRNYLEAEDELKLFYPSPHICSKVRHLLERETEYLRDVCYKRLSYSINIPCPCAKTCQLHGIVKCTHFHCMHLLTLNECLTKKVIECEFRLIRTDFIQKYFFSASIKDEFTKCSESIQLDCISNPDLWNEHDPLREDLSWLTQVGKMLTCANTGHDWIALARRLSYNEREIRMFGEEAVPPVTLLEHWINSNGRTRYCIDLLISCLEQIGRMDVANYMSLELGHQETPSPPVFISYHWDSQESVLQLRRRIELAGYPCWMDVGHLMAGDALYGKIYEGINKSKVILCCLTPRYILSPLCTREMSLADVLRKPIVPIILEPTPWPPPGALALILSSLVYVDLCGIGGHGGSGRQADWESRFSSIIERLTHFITPSFVSPPLSNMPSERHVAAPPSPMLIRSPEEFLDALDPSSDEQETMPLPDEDSASESGSTPDPTVWVAPQRNRVIRCSVCVLI